MAGLELAGGRVLGREHAAKGGNCQDAFAPHVDGATAIAVVCDGCSNGVKNEPGMRPIDRVDASRNEIGANLISRLVACRLDQALAHDPEIRGPELWERVRTDVLQRVMALANGMGGSFSRAISNYFACTVIAMYDDPRGSEFAVIGDGELIVNGERIALGPFPGNAPPYMVYDLVQTDLKASDPDILKFKIVRSLEPGELQNFLIGTDGVKEIMDAEAKTFPGTGDVVGPVNQLWTADKYFKNSDMVRRFLAKLNMEKKSVDWAARELVHHGGLIQDDAALIVGRRKMEGTT